MLRAFGQAFRTPDLRKKILFSLLIMVLYRIGTYIPSPGVSTENINECVGLQESSSLLNMVDMFSGGALMQLSIFALGIMPYITASIIIQILRVAVPRFEDLHKEGQTGRSKLTQYTRYLTIFLAILQSTTMIALASSGQMYPNCSLDIIPDGNAAVYALIVVVMTAGTTVIMWFGELITERGVGNGMSLLIFTSIVAQLPSQLWSISQTNGWGTVGIIGLLILVVTVAVIYVEQSQRRIPVQYAKRMVGRRTYGGTTTYIPLKINMAGVIPVIFATSILSLPALAAQFADTESSWVQWVYSNLTSSSGWYMAINAMLILAFTFFYTAITFNPDEIADNMKRYGGFIPGYRAGRPTAEYLRFVMHRITTVGAIYLVIIALIPSLAMAPLNLSASQMPFGGTTLLIMVGVGLQTVKEVNSQLQQHHYEGFLK